MKLMDAEAEIESHRSSCDEIRREEKMKVLERKKGCKLKVVTTPSIPYVRLQKKIHWKKTETREIPPNRTQLYVRDPYTLFVLII